MDASSEAEFEKVKCLLDRISWPMTLLGIWPKNLTRSGQLKFTIFITYFTIHLSMQLLDLANVVGHLELVVVNLTETSFQTMAMFRILITRLGKTTCRLIDAIQEDLSIEKFHDPQEIRILFNYTKITDKFYRLGVRFAAFSAFMYYVTPLQTYFIAKMTNGTAILVNPYRIYHFIDLSPIERTAVVYAFQFPIMYTGVFFVASYSVLLGFVTNFCAHLAILNHRMTTMKDKNADHRVVFRRHTQQHIKILIMAQWLNDAYHVALLYELLTTTILLGLIVYQFLLVISVLKNTMSIAKW
ncbi:uncharacterized protein [Fopius arisanus]|uniref:Odorant receptor n=1 Tax=Fopius arisanus TaxID=64838 RepID=A0A0C9PS93_9HYME|nr:PREDICTED: uncharacterized protein LOC105266404 [Fopius arisanus]